MSIWTRIADVLASIGESVGAFLQQVASRNPTPPEKSVAFTIGMIGLGAKMAKADGVVTTDEIEAFKEIFKVPPNEMANVARIFNMAKQDVAGFESYATQIASILKDDRQLLEDVLHGLFYIATADNVFHPGEETFLKEVARRFAFFDHEYRQVRSRFLPEDKRDPYVVLGIERTITDDELKSHYRRLVVENHPDKAIARGMPPEFVKIATAKVAAINEAYEAIRKERSL